MSPESFSETCGSSIWLAVYGMTALGLAFSLFRVFRGPPAELMRHGRRGALILLATGSLPLLDFGQRLGAPLAETGRLLAQTVLFLAALFAIGLLFSPRRPLAAHAAHRLKYGIAAGLLLIGLPAMAWSSHRLHEAPLGEFPQPPVHLPTEENLDEITEVDLRTDQGQKIPVFRLVNVTQSLDTLVAQLENIEPDYSWVAMRRSPAELHTNCHGWVFTDGKYIIRGSSVERILKDNAYQQVAEPEPGDLIVYRDVDNSILHTGVVKAIGKDGFSLIESKWGFHGRFLHESKVQAYSDNYAFYRSPRSGHLLKVRFKPARTPDSARLPRTGHIG